MARYYLPSQCVAQKNYTEPIILIWAIDFDPVTEEIEPLRLTPETLEDGSSWMTHEYTNDSGYNELDFPEDVSRIFINKYCEFRINLATGLCCFTRAPLITRQESEWWYETLEGKNVWNGAYCRGLPYFLRPDDCGVYINLSNYSEDKIELSIVDAIYNSDKIIYN